MRICSVEDCNGEYYCKSLCQKHYYEKYNKQYRQENKEYIAKLNKQYYKDNKEHFKQYQQDNKEHIAKQMKQWREDNKEHCIKYDKKYYQDHKECKAKYDKQYNKINKEYRAKKSKLYRKENFGYFTEHMKQYRKTLVGKAIAIADRHNRRALTKDLTKEIIQKVYEDNIKKFGTLTCYLCNKPIAFGDDSLEHSTPLSRGGNNNYNNLGIAHLNCNISKHAMTLDEWFINKNR